ncbi:hypothetical protein [Moraxella oblonga]|uniref:hypothetical protein n=1 Tax=Moraxella oblonga TaxID=200413 RepID=UPI00082F84A3|nr:hypothetical protein [Moraxella oblonga]
MKLSNIKLPNIKLPIINVNTDPLDAMLYGLGLRLAWLDNHNDEKFNKIIADKNIAILFQSDGMARYYRFQDGRFGQASGKPKEADLTIAFKESLAGAKLLAKGDLASLMSAIQDGDVVVTGDYKLVMWFASLAKYAVATPKKYEPYVDKVKPYLKKAKRILKK